MFGHQTPTLLVVEDSDEDFFALQRMMKRASIPHRVERCTDGDDALDFLYHTGKYVDNQTARPSLILLDLNLPGTDGREVLHQLKQDDSMKIIPVVVFSTSSNPKDIEACYEYGVNSYILKPIDVDQLKTTIEIFSKYWFQVISLPDT
jgi:CheY-like chemotaxis protein